MTRRDTLKTLAFLVVTTASGMDCAVAAAKPTRHVYPDYGWLRGFSIVPSWAARIEDA